MRARSEKADFDHPEQGKNENAPGFDDHQDGIERGEPGAAQADAAGEAVDGGEAVQREAEAGRGGDDSRQQRDQPALEGEAGGDQKDRAEKARQGEIFRQARPRTAQPPRHVDGARGEPEIDGEQHDLQGGDARRRAHDGDPFHAFRADFAGDRRQVRDELIELRREILERRRHRRLEAMIMGEQQSDAGAGDQNRQQDDGFEHCSRRGETQAGVANARGQRRLDHGGQSQRRRGEAKQEGEGERRMGGGQQDAGADERANHGAGQGKAGGADHQRQRREIGERHRDAGAPRRDDEQKCAGDAGSQTHGPVGP